MPIRLDVERPIWSRFFTVAPLVIVGGEAATKEKGRRLLAGPT
jgi:hypothetical protein